MLERNELITVCRHIGGMMEAGVDILRITRVLRAQTETPRLLQLYDALDRDMTMGRSLAEAMSRAPDVFSPFVVQMIQQGEARNDLAGAFLKVADFLRQEQELDENSPHHESSTREVFIRGNIQDVADGAHDQTSLTRPNAPDLLPSRSATTSPLTVIALDGLMDRMQTFMLRALTIMSGLMLSLACVWWMLELGYVEKRWGLPLAFSVTAVFLGGAGTWIQRRIRAERRREARCSFCGRQGIDLQRAPRFAGAAICARCAEIVAKKSAEETTNNTISAKNDATESDATSDATANDATASDATAEAVHATVPPTAPYVTSSTRVDSDEVFNVPRDVASSGIQHGARVSDESDSSAYDASAYTASDASEVVTRFAATSNEDTRENSSRKTENAAPRFKPTKPSSRKTVPSDDEEDFE